MEIKRLRAFPYLELGGLCNRNHIRAGRNLRLGHHRLRHAFFGLELPDMARDVAAFKIPARVGHLFGVSM
jgi:hypothetical protein